MGRAFEFRKGRKMKRWSKMAKQFSRIGKDIVVAVKEGGPDPDSNPRLRAVMQNAKAVNMPKDNVERAIKKATDKDTANYFEVNFEGYAPHGVAIFVECSSDNNNRTVANVRSHFNKGNGNLGTAGSVEFMFERKCHFKISDTGFDLEELEFDLIDFGVEEVFAEEQEEDSAEKFIMLYGAFESFGSIQSAIEAKEIEIVESGFERIPTDTKELNAEQVEEVENLLERLEEDDDVNVVFHNMA